MRLPDQRRVDRHAILTAWPRSWSRTRRQHHRAELDSENKYLKAQHDLADRYSEQGARLKLEEHEKCVKQQIAEAEAERKEVRHCWRVATRRHADTPWHAAAADAERRLRRSMPRTCRPSLAREACPSRWASPPTSCSKTTSSRSLTWRSARRRCTRRRLSNSAEQ